MENYIWPSVIVYLVGGIIFSALCRSIARQKGYEKSGRFALAGFFFGLPTLLYEAGLPDLLVRQALAALAANGQQPAAAPAAGSAQDPAIIAVLAAAVAMAMSDDQQYTAQKPAAPAPSTAASPAVASSAAGFTVRQVRRV